MSLILLLDCDLDASPVIRLNDMYVCYICSHSCTLSSAIAKHVVLRKVLHCCS